MYCHLHKTMLTLPSNLKHYKKTDELRWLNSSVLSKSDEKHRRNDFVGKKSSSKIRDRFRQKSERNRRIYFRRTTDDSFRRDIFHRKFVGHIPDRSDHQKKNSDEIYMSEISERCSLEYYDAYISSEMSDHNSFRIVRQLSHKISSFGYFYL